MPRPALPQRPRADPPAGERRAALLPRAPRSTDRELGAHGPDQRSVRGRDQGLRRAREHPDRRLQARRAQGRHRPRAPGPLRRRRGRPVHRPGPGEDHGVPDREAAQPDDGQAVRLDRPVHRDRRPVLRLRRRRRLRSLLPEVQLVLPVHRAPVRQRPRVGQAQAGATTSPTSRSTTASARVPTRPGSRRSARGSRRPGSGPSCASGSPACRTRSPTPTGRPATATSCRSCRPRSA